MQTLITIDRDVPLPEGAGRGGPPKYPFRKMEIGDSFEAPNSASLVRSAHAFGSRNGRKFATRRHGDQVRVWRVA